MKQIGHIDGATTETAWKTHTLGMLSPHDLFIPNPGERENVNADHWTHVGWVDPDKDGGQIWGSHAEAGDNSRPAYVRVDTAPPVPIDTPRSDSDLIENAMTAIVRLNKRLDDLENRYDGAVKDLFLAVQPKSAPSVTDQPMTFYDHAFITCAVHGLLTGSKLDEAVRDAHKLAGHLTRNRANQP